MHSIEMPPNKTDFSNVLGGLSSTTVDVLKHGSLHTIQARMEAGTGGFWGRGGGRLGTNAPGPRQEYLRALINRL